MDNKKRFGIYMQQKRKEVGHTQKSLAQKLYISESAVSKWERGITYPDLSLILDICEILGVSERELLTASEDTETRTNEKLANNYLKLKQRYKWILSLMYGITILICFIANLASQQTLSWFYIVLTSILTMASVTLLPVVVNKSRGILTLASGTFSLLLLLFVCNIYSNGDWFLLVAVSTLFGVCAVFLPYVFSNIGLPESIYAHKALLSMLVDTILLFAVLVVAIPQQDILKKGIFFALLWLLIPWGMLIIISYTKINVFFKTSACIGLTSLVWFLNHWLINVLLYSTPMLSESKVVFVALFALTVAFSVAGIDTALKYKSINNI